MNIIQQLEKSQMKAKIPEFRIGDTLKIYSKIVEGDRERTQMFSGTLISRKGRGLSETITLRRISYGEGVERIFLLHSPRIEKIEVEQKAKKRVRRSKLYYLRTRVGKEAQGPEAARERIAEEAPATQKTEEAKIAK